MEYVQMTLDDWVQMKQQLKQELLGVTKGFVRIGYTLRQMSDQKLYERDGYKSMAEFAKAEYGLGPDTVSRFMKINEKFSEGGYSQKLDARFANMGRSQLEEMLTLPEGDYQMIQPETAREDIRELKRFNKIEPKTGVADDILKLVEAFYEVNPEILNAVFGKTEFEEQNIKGFAEIVNPGGNRSFKKGLFFMMMYENRVAVKKFGADPKDMSWWEFYQITRDIFGETAAGDETWKRYFGAEEIAPAQESAAIKEKEHREDGDVTEKKEDKGECDEQRDEDGTVAESGHAEEESVNRRETEEIAPAQNSAETKKTEDCGGSEDERRGAVRESAEAEPERAAGSGEEITGQREITRDFPEYCPPEMVSHEETKEEETVEVERPEKAYTSRLLYMASQGDSGAGEYMARTMEEKIRGMNNVSFSVLAKPVFWEEFFGAEVDKEGREIECV